MKRYWLDADVLIQAANGWYPFHRAAAFWSFLDEQVEDGRVCSSTKVYGEILHRDNDKEELTRWIKNRRTSGMFIKPDGEKDVQHIFGKIADHVLKKYASRRPKAEKFLSGADGWIIAQAKHDGGIVVAHECRVDKASLTPKIPNVCTDFDVDCLALTDMLDKLKFKF